MQGDRMKRTCLFYKPSKLLMGFLVLSALQAWNASAQTPETFIPTGNMTTPRHFHTATLLKDGRVLIAGGEYAPYPSPNPSNLPVTWASAELYDPATGRFSTTGSMTEPRTSHTATLLPDGRVLIAGGRRYGITTHFDTTFLATAELYDPVTGTFTPTGDMVQAQDRQTATLLNNGKVLISGGFGWTVSVAMDELYDPATGAFNRVGMGSPGSQASALFDGRILIVGGYYSATSLLYDAATNTAESLGYPARPIPVVAHTSTLLPTGKVLIAGGNALDKPYEQSPMAHAELYDPDTRTFQTTASLLFAREGHQAIRLPGGQVLIAGGFGCGRCAELFDPYTETFRLTGSMTRDREYPTATLLGNGRVLITGEYNSASAELYIPPLPPPLTFERTRLRGGDSFTATFSGPGLTDETYYDLRFRAPGDSTDYVALNWQQGRSATHNVATGMPTGTWTVTGMRAHQDIDDHAADFVSVSVELLVTQ
jgi:Galactose oxidase, central domain